METCTGLGLAFTPSSYDSMTMKARPDRVCGNECERGWVASDDAGGAAESDDKSGGVPVRVRGEVLGVAPLKFEYNVIDEVGDAREVGGALVSGAPSIPTSLEFLIRSRRMCRAQRSSGPAATCGSSV